MEAVRIVRATEARMPEVARVHQASFRHTYPDFPVLHTAEEDRFYFTNIVFEKNTIYVAEEPKTSRILGFIAFNFHTIEHLYLLPEALRTGLGSRLLEFATKEGRPLKLWTFQRNAAALAFYKKHGFVVLKETDGSANEEKQPDVLLEWRPLRAV